MLCVDAQLLAEDAVSCLVGLCGVGVEQRVGVDGPELAVPDGGFEVVHERGFAEELLLQLLLLRVGACVRRACRKAHRLLPSLVEILPLHCERVSVQEQNVMWINFSDGGFDPVIESQESPVLWIARPLSGSYPATHALSLYRAAICSHSHTVRS